MLTVPAEFAQRAGRRSASNRILLDLVATNGAVFKFATDAIPFVVGGTPFAFHGIITEVSPVSRSVDFYDKTVEYANCQVVLSALPYTRGAAIVTGGMSDWRRVTDSIQKVMGGNAVMMLHAGGATPASESNVLIIGYFTVTNIQMSGDSVILNLREGNASGDTNDKRRLDLILPSRKATRTEFPALPNDRIGVGLPLLWGAYSTQYPAVLSEWGYHPIERVDDLKFVVADHNIGTGSSPILYIMVPALKGFAYTTSLLTWEMVNGHYTVTVQNATLCQLTMVVSPTRITCSYASTIHPPPLAVDDDLISYASLIANSATEAVMYFKFGHEGAPEDSAEDNSIASILINTAAIYLEMMTLLAPTTSTLDYWNGSSWVNFQTNVYSASNPHYFHPAYDWINSTDGVFWHFASGLKGKVFSAPFTVRLRYTGSGWTAGVTELARIYEARWQCTVYDFFARQVPDHFERYWLVGHEQPRMLITLGHTEFRDLSRYSYGYRGPGRAFGSWIDEPGRSNPFSTGELNEKPPFIIESILREECGFVTARIDTASFDAFYASDPLPTCVVSLPAGSSISAKALIERICFENVYAYCFCRANRQWALKGATGTVATVTILPDELEGQTVDLGLTSLDRLRNDYVVRSRFVAGEWKRSITGNDSISVARWGTFNGDGVPIDVMSMVSISYVNSALGRLLYWTAYPHGTIRARLSGWKYAGLELLDYVSFDKSLDRNILYFDQTWDAKVFLVMGVSVDLDGVTLDLYDPTPFGWT